MKLIDLHCKWALQYTGETCQYHASAYPDVRARLSQLDGYLTDTSVTVLACGRRAQDWSHQADPWKALAETLARYEAEFSGRLLVGPDDLTRRDAEPDDGMCWGVLGIVGFDSLIRQPGDLDHLPGLFECGVRFFQLLETEASVLGGSARSDDERGLTELGQGFLDRLVEIARSQGPSAPRPVIDLADLNERTTADVLDWLEADGQRIGSLWLARSHGGMRASVSLNSGLSAGNLLRLRALGGFVGLTPGIPFIDSAEALREAIEAVAEVPFWGAAGYMGIGIGTDFLNLMQTLPHLGNVSQITQWLAATFATQDAALLIQGNARVLLNDVTGGIRPQSPRR